MKEKICFVIIGYDTKFDHNTGKYIDFEKTYRNIIKPVFDELNIICFRAKDIEHSGIIDVPMYDSILKADYVLADLTALNANVLYELGIRHAVKKNTTILICDNEIKLPFDINHILVDKFEHLGKAIDHEEVLRFRALLKSKILALEKAPKIDSPLYTFFPMLNTPYFTDKEIAEIKENIESEEKNESINDLINNAEDAKNVKDFNKAIGLLTKAKNLTADNEFIIQRLALATYKSKAPNETDALFRAQLILNELNPENTTNVETLGLMGAINKRLYECLDEFEFLDASLNYYERGFYIANDYYTGINTAFIHNIYASVIDDQFEAMASFGNARRIRKQVINVCNKIIESKIWDERDDREWVLLTLAECHYGLDEFDKEIETLEKAKQFLNKDFSTGSYQEQREKLINYIEMFNQKFNK